MDEIGEVLEAYRAITKLEGPGQDRALEQLREERPVVAEHVTRLLERDSRNTPSGNSQPKGIPRSLLPTVGPLLTPARIGAFRVIREIGRGGMGVVYEAEQDRPRRRVALKTLLPLASTGRAHARFQVEVQALAQLLHPGIPQVYEAFEHEHRPVLAMELVDGRNLTEVCLVSPPREVLRLMAAVADAVQHAHEGGVLHRDLKPANVLVTEAGTPKVLDFGIASLGRSRADRSGTPAYMAPEQMAGEPVDARADVYSLGVMAWQLLTHRLPIPIEGLGPDDILSRKRAGPRELAGVTPSVDAVLARTLAPDPARRTPSARVFAEELRRILRHERVRSGPVPTLHRMSLYARRHKQRMLGAAIGLATVAVIASTATAVVGQIRHTRLEAHAQAELQALKDLAGPLGSDSARLQEAVDAFVNAPAHQGTRALAQAWLWRAGEASVHDRTQALTQAWVTSVHQEESERALRSLARKLHQDERWLALEGILQELPPQALPEARRAIAARHWELTELRGLTEPSLHPLIDALTRRQLREERVVALWQGRMLVRDQQEVWLESGDDPTARTILPHSLELHGATLSHQGVVVERASGEQAWWNGESLQPVTTNPRLGYRDVPRHEASLGFGRGTFLLRMGQEPWRSPLDSALLGPSMIRDADLGDVDGDGRLDAVLAPAGWRGSGVQVWSDILGPEPRLIHRQPGFPDAVKVFRDPSGADRIVWAGKPDGTLPLQPPDEERPASHLWVIDLHGDAPTTDGPYARLASKAYSLVVADLDGDGLDDIVTSSRADGATLLRQLPDGALVGLEIPMIGAYRATNLDDDPAAELHTRIGIGEQDLLIGVGEPVPDGVRPPRPVPAPIPEDLPEDLHAPWARAETLAARGLVSEAVAAWSHIGHRSGRPGRLALRRALEALVTPVSQGVGSLDENPAWADIATRLAERPHLSDEDHRATRAALREVLELGHLARLDGRPFAPDVVLEPEEADAWTLHDPTAVALDPTTGTLILDLVGGQGPALSLTVRRTGGPVQARLVLDVEEQDWVAGLSIELSGEGFSRQLDMGRGGGGPAENHRMSVWCGGPRSARHLGGHHERLRMGPREVAFTLDPELGRMRCAMGNVSFQQPLDEDLPETMQLTIRPPAQGHQIFVARLRARLHHLELRGLEVLPPDAPDPLLPLMHGELEAARQALGHTSHRVRLAAAGRMGLHGEIDLRDLTAWELAILLRRDPEGWAAPIQASRPEDFLTAWRTAWITADEYEMPWRMRAMGHPALQTIDLGHEAGPDVALFRARVLLEEGRALEGRVLLEDIVRHEDHPGAWRMLAGLRLAAGDRAGALQAVERWRASTDNPFAVDDALRTDPTLMPLADQETVASVTP